MENNQNQNMNQDDSGSSQADFKKMQEKLVEELGLSDVPKEKQEELLIKMTEAVLKRVFVEVMEKLEYQDQEAYVKMIEDKVDPDEIDEFLKSKINDYEKLVEKVVDDFKTEMKQSQSQ